MTSTIVLTLADMNPSKIQPTDIEAAINTAAFSLRCVSSFRDAHCDLILSLKACSENTYSKWDVIIQGQPLAARAKEVTVDDLPSFVKWLSSQRRLRRGRVAAAGA